MSLVSKIIIVFLLLSAVPPLCFCGEIDNDKWFAADKFKHFSLSALYAGGITLVANRHFDLGEEKSVSVGIGVTISLGAVKEIADRKRPEETSSIKDLIWDIAGAVTGALVVGMLL